MKIWLVDGCERSHSDWLRGVGVCLPGCQMSRLSFSTAWEELSEEAQKGRANFERCFTLEQNLYSAYDLKRRSMVLYLSCHNATGPASVFQWQISYILNASRRRLLNIWQPGKKQLINKIPNRQRLSFQMMRKTFDISQKQLVWCFPEAAGQEKLKCQGEQKFEKIQKAKSLPCCGKYLTRPDFNII